MVSAGDGGRVFVTGWLGLQTHAFVWTPLLGMQDLGTLGDPGAVQCGDSGQWRRHDWRVMRRDLWQEATTSAAGALDHGADADLGTLGGAEGFANGMNEQGDIVGESQTPNGVFHATLWPVEGTP